MEYKSKEKMTEDELNQWWLERPFGTKKGIYGVWLNLNL